MENPNEQDLIEQYIDGTLSPTEREAVEARIASDEAFRAKVNLQRQLQQEFADAKKLQLRHLMADIVRETPTPPEPAKTMPYKTLIIIGLLLLGIWAVWQMSRPESPNPSVAPTPPGSQTPTQIAPKPVESPSTPPAKTPPAPIALNNPAAFKPNPAFEARLGNGGIRNSDGPEATMTSPGLGANVNMVNGLVKITFSGSVLPDDDTAQYPLLLKIYANTSAAEEVAQFSPRLQDRNASQWAFSTAQSLRLSNGLYYFTLERQAEAELVFVGKFTVGAK